MATATASKPKKKQATDAQLVKHKKEILDAQKERDKAEATLSKANDKLAKKISAARKQNIGIIQIGRWLGLTRQAIYKFLESRDL